MDINSTIEFVKSHPVQAATVASVAASLIAKWTSNAKSKVMQRLHTAVAAFSTKHPVQFGK